MKESKLTAHDLHGILKADCKRSGMIKDVDRGQSAFLKEEIVVKLVMVFLCSPIESFPREGDRTPSSDRCVR
jgi:hypothetical protein